MKRMPASAPPSGEDSATASASITSPRNTTSGAGTALDAVAAETDDAAGRNIGMKDRAFPRQFGHRPRVRSPQPNMNLVFVADQHIGFWIGLPEAAAEEPQHVKIGRRAVVLKAENRARGG